MSLGYGTHSTATEENRADVSTIDAERLDVVEVLVQGCAGSGVCLGSVAGRNSRGHRSDTDVGQSVPKPAPGRS